MERIKMKMHQQQQVDNVVYGLLCQAEKEQLSKENESFLARCDRLSLHGPEYEYLPTSISLMRSLTTLDLRGTNISSIPTSLFQLKEIKQISLSGTLICTLPKEIGQLTALTQLDLSGSQLKELPDSIGFLKRLEVLNLEYTPLSNLPRSFCELIALRWVSLKRSKLKLLPETIDKLTNIEVLNINSTEVLRLPPSIGGLTELSYLDISRTGVSQLPESIVNCNRLRFLNISNTLVARLPKALALGNLSIIKEPRVKTGVPGIYADGSKLPSFYYDGKDVLEKYFSVNDSQSFQEAKIIILGDGSAGKTFLTNRIINHGEPEPEDEPYSHGQTHGVKPYDYLIPNDQSSFTIHLWDFGGQETLHAMHKCFLTENTVYVLMVSTRDSEHTRRLRYWLHTILPYVHDGKVFIIINCFDNQRRADIDRIGLASEFQPYMSLFFVEISIKNATQEDFKNCIIAPLISSAKEASEKAGLHPSAYIRVRERLRAKMHKIFEDKKQRYIDRETFIRYCNDEGINNPSLQVSLLRLLTNLGVCFCALKPNEIDVPRECKLIEPIWLTNALYAIIEECKAQNGIVYRTAIHELLSKPKSDNTPIGYERIAPDYTYEKTDCDYILEIAANYSIIYEETKESSTVFIPSMCHYQDKSEKYGKPERPAYNVIGEFCCHYLPETVIQRLMIDCMNAGYNLSICWRGGFQLQSRHCNGVLESMEDDRTIRFDIWSTDQEDPIRTVLGDLRVFIERNELINDDLQEFILYDGERFSVKQLYNSDKNSIVRIAGEKGPSYVVRDLLGSYPIVTRSKDQIWEDPWTAFSIIHENPNIAFQRLCWEFFSTEYLDKSTFPNMPNNYPGIEGPPVKSNNTGLLVGFQSKFFSSTPGPTQYKNIQDSMDKAVSRFKGENGLIILYCNKDINPQRTELENSRALLASYGITLECRFGYSLWKEIKEKQPTLIDSYFSL